MWEQYAEDHRGVCLVFRRDELVARFVDQMAALGTLHYHDEVTYTPEGFSNSDARDVRRGDFDQTAPFANSAADYIEQHYRDFFFLKSADWATEVEYRFTLQATADPGDVELDFGDALEAVVVGENFPFWLFPSARFATEGTTGVDRLTWDSGAPEPTSYFREG